MGPCCRDSATTASHHAFSAPLTILAESELAPLSPWHQRPVVGSVYAARPRSCTAPPLQRRANTAGGRCPLVLQTEKVRENDPSGPRSSGPGFPRLQCP